MAAHPDQDGMAGGLGPATVGGVATQPGDNQPPATADMQVSMTVPLPQQTVSSTPYQPGGYGGQQGPPLPPLPPLPPTPPTPPRQELPVPPPPPPLPLLPMPAARPQRGEAPFQEGQPAMPQPQAHDMPGQSASQSWFDQQLQQQPRWAPHPQLWQTPSVVPQPFLAPAATGTARRIFGCRTASICGLCSSDFASGALSDSTAASTALHPHGIWYSRTRSTSRTREPAYTFSVTIRGVVHTLHSRPVR